MQICSTLSVLTWFFLWLVFKLVATLQKKTKPPLHCRPSTESDLLGRPRRVWHKMLESKASKTRRFHEKRGKTHMNKLNKSCPTWTYEHTRSSHLRFVFQTPEQNEETSLNDGLFRENNKSPSTNLGPDRPKRHPNNYQPFGSWCIHQEEYLHIQIHILYLLNAWTFIHQHVPCWESGGVLNLPYNFIVWTWTCHFVC